MKLFVLGKAKLFYFYLLYNYTFSSYQEQREREKQDLEYAKEIAEDDEFP